MSKQPSANAQLVEAGQRFSVATGGAVMLVQIKATSVGWYQLRVGADQLQVAEEAARLPGVKLVEAGGGHTLELPQNAVPFVCALGLSRTQLLDGRNGSFRHPLRRLFSHQEVAVEWLLERSGGLLADEPGLGKTSVAAVAVQEAARRQGGGLCVIVGPPYVESVWRRELYALGYVTSPDDVAAARGTRAYEKALSGSLDSGWMFVPFHLAEEWTSFCRVSRAGRVVATVVDEAHWAKNPKSKRGIAMRNIAGLASFRVLLTGTPMGNRPNELWNLLTALDGAGSWGSFHEFRVRYCGAEHSGHGYADTRPTNVEELNQRMKWRYLRRTVKSEGIKLPVFRREPLYVTMTPEISAEYEQLVGKLLGGRGGEELLDALERGVFGKDTLRQMTSLRKFTSRVKIDATVALALDCLEAGHSVLVFAWERAVVQKITAKLCRYAAVAEITGEVLPAERQRRVDAFQLAHDGMPRVLVATGDTLGEGVTLTRASRVIMHDLSWVPSEVLQREARANRIGQDKPVVSTWPLLRNSFDVLLAKHLVSKGDQIERVLGMEEARIAAEVFDGDLRRQTVDAAAMLKSWARGVS